MFFAVTIDTETPQTPYKQGRVKECMMEIDAQGQAVGSRLIVDELEQRGLRGVFFVNVYEATKWGEQPLAELCQRIHQGGHEIGLHTHPMWAFDPKREHLWQYSRDEQSAIIKHGLELLRAWVPEHSVHSHRAGAYGLNQDTLAALLENGIEIDSSIFPDHANCKLQGRINLPELHRSSLGDILEFPVTGFYRERRFGWPGIPLLENLLDRTRFIKSDINWAGNGQLRWFIHQMAALPEASGFVLNLFLHSYSFIELNSIGRKIKVNEDALTRFRHLLDMLVQSASATNSGFAELLDNSAIQQMASSHSQPSPPRMVETIRPTQALMRLLKRGLH